MQEITTVRVYSTPTVSGCSHSDTEPYKNLPQSDCTVTVLLQLGPTAGAEGRRGSSIMTQGVVELNNNRVKLELLYA